MKEEESLENTEEGHSDRFSEANIRSGHTSSRFVHKLLFFF
jgi:hypothetical protein